MAKEHKNKESDNRFLAVCLAVTPLVAALDLSRSDEFVNLPVWKALIHFAAEFGASFLFTYVAAFFGLHIYQFAIDRRGKDSVKRPGFWIIYIVVLFFICFFITSLLNS